MRFYLETSGFSYRDEKDVKKLEKLGFKFEKQEKPALRWYKRGEQILHIDFNSLDELVTLVAEYGKVIIQPPHEDGWDWNIEIYDNYRE
jgi:hypothetical protein